LQALVAWLDDEIEAKSMWQSKLAALEEIIISSTGVSVPEAAGVSFVIAEGDRFNYAPWGGTCVATWHDDELWMRCETQPSTDGKQIWKARNGAGAAMLRGEKVPVLWDNTASLLLEMTDERTIVVLHDTTPCEFNRVSAPAAKALPPKAGGLCLCVNMCVPRFCE
jgi:hypothetical protein